MDFDNYLNEYLQYLSEESCVKLLSIIYSKLFGRRVDEKFKREESEVRHEAIKQIVDIVLDLYSQVDTNNYDYVRKANNYVDWKHHFGFEKLASKLFNLCLEEGLDEEFLKLKEDLGILIDDDEDDDNNVQ